ncbi:MAG: YbaB/EbfC family nucleoid-associated protein [Phycisphaerales bacterium]|nr:YbaB/EbfC family nucleoid-associated protein [Phycisphaerales bacterium]
MFDSLRTMGAMASLMKNKDQLRAAAERVKESLASLRVTGEAGGGAVRVTASGRFEVVRVEIAPAVAAALSGDGARAQVEALIAEATNDALRRAQERAREVMSREAEAMGVPELSGVLGQALGGA